MKRVQVLCVALVIGLSTTAAFGRGGMGHMMGPSPMSVTGGAFERCGAWHQLVGHSTLVIRHRQGHEG